MRWRDSRRSSNVEDRRGLPVGRAAIGGGGALIVLLLALLFGADPAQLLQQMQATGVGTTTSTSGEAAPPQDEMAEFVAVVLAETEDVWAAQFEQLGQRYEAPKLVIFDGQVQSACGMASAAMGPFYCPSDRQVYIDLSFYRLLRERLGAPGDFAQAYVIAHEVGHHVQHLLGVTDQVHAARGRVSEVEYNALSVKLELQADYFAGVWAHHAQRTKGLLEPGDIEEAMVAAESIGDDKLQRESQGHVVPDAFTHGTSEQRQRWFMLGYQTGDMRRGDTFRAERL